MGYTGIVGCVCVAAVVDEVVVVVEIVGVVVAVVAVVIVVDIDAGLAGTVTYSGIVGVHCSRYCRSRVGRLLSGKTV